MVTIKFKRGSADTVGSYVGEDGEVVIDKTNQALRIHDGTTAGGHIVSGGNQSSNDLATAIEQTIGFYNGYNKQSLDYRDYLTNDDSATLEAIYGLGNGYIAGTAGGGSGSAGTIGTAGTQGFGVGIYPGTSDELSAAGLTPMDGCDDVTSDNYGNYQHTNGSIMCFIPAFCYRIGQSTAPSYARDGTNALEIGPAELDGTDNWILHRAFIDGGQKKSGFFIDKYINSKSSDGLTAVSVKNGNPISLTTSTSYNTSSTMTGGTGYLKDAITFGRSRGDQYSCITSFQWSAISMLSLAHAQASTSTEFCAQYDSANTTNFPKGNNDTKADINDSSITFTASNATSSESDYYTKAGSGVPFAKTTHNGQNCGISDVNGNKYQMCIGYCSFTSGTNYVLKESIKAHDITTSNVSTTSNYDRATGYSSTGRYYWGANAFHTDSSGPNRAMCGVMAKTQTTSTLKIFGDDYCYFFDNSAFAARVGGRYDYGPAAGVFCRDDGDWSDYNDGCGCRCSGYLS